MSRGALSFRAVRKVYDPEGKAVLALDGVDLDIAPGEFCAIVGPSGCGKTTLLNAVAGFETLTAGAIQLDGRTIATPDASAAPGEDRIVVFQNGALFPWRSVMWNITCGPVMQGRMSEREAREHGLKLLARVGLKGCEDKYPNDLSGGQKRRVEIVRALINDPAVLLLDEPFRALDALTKSVMQEYLLELLVQFPKTVFFITHDLEEALFLGDKVVVFTSRPGRIKEVVSVDIPKPRSHEVLTSPRFLELKAALSAVVHTEAMRAFEAGEKEMAR
ncbi:ABC transporter ATP-binding protein [Xanthobacter tagetidis]|jgi:NitT/TauT family transport system ATP-binding protein|uniref:ABC transporter ATP-binding protein n=1 Tax=Xanthobacter tagetidis TaxID=60216 RepID=A0A3L7AGF9_9HYPH|nr:ABC transporter ATP-binding protein [Xanthobacter tagetidis]MBB6308468.1 NitT/TauT family transport system ATP-binding protein [Xanthobacter tagetidis]RLP78751.1 ABC transporter ATP-binding protein [Xanthobacter tagetidis]